MHRAVVFALVAALLSPCAEGAGLPPHVAAIATTPEARACFDEILRLGAYGRTSAERAAFIVQDGGGELRCVVWPATNAFQSAKWDGPWPDGTLAVAHTHPRSLPRPSRHDADEAARLKIPILVVTPGQITSTP